MITLVSEIRIKSNSYLFEQQILQYYPSFQFVSSIPSSNINSKNRNQNVSQV